MGLRESALRHRPPSRLAGRLEAALRAADAPRRPWPRPALWAAAAAVLLAAGVAAWAVLRSRTQTDADDRLDREAVAAHARSLQEQHLLDRPSSDRHEVKPWFQSRLDFAPPVKDLSKHGFELAGGRLDYLDERPVAALVYRRREHAINLFVWLGGSEDAGVRTATRRGYHLAAWTGDGFHFHAVSDLNGEELAEFVRLLREDAGR